MAHFWGVGGRAEGGEGGVCVCVCVCVCGNGNGYGKERERGGLLLKLLCCVVLWMNRSDS